jgi:hypothetical protein
VEFFSELHLAELAAKRFGGRGRTLGRLGQEEYTESHLTLLSIPLSNGCVGGRFARGLKSAIFTKDETTGGRACYLIEE